MKVIISCSGKFHAFALAEQLERHGMLHMFYTSYSSIKNPIAKYLVSRRDRETIPKKKISANLLIAIGLKAFGSPFFWNDLFDRWIAWKIRRSNADVFIGWSGMSLRAVEAAKRKGMITILERGSAHITEQFKILKEEYQRFGIDFIFDSKTHDKELLEYKEVDYISVASKFVADSFVEYGIDRKKININPYGSPSYFLKSIHQKEQKSSSSKFTVVYLGSLAIRKGIYYLFEALEKFSKNKNDVNFLFVGSIREEVKPLISEYKKDNWDFTGHIAQHELPAYLTGSDVGVIPSLEDGFGMVVPQMLSCGIPVIVSENTGSKDLIKDGENGFIIPIRDSKQIYRSLEKLYKDRVLLHKMKYKAESKANDLSWDSYGVRYYDFISKIIKYNKP